MLGQRLRVLRQSHGKTQSEIAGLLNISRSAYALYEAGKRQLSYDSLVILADYYQVSLDYLFGRTDVPELQHSFTPEERRLLSRYRTMDGRGRETLQALADAECFITSGKKQSVL
ncbi:helix-turn-helix transcriptional regulator [uncultured Pseudoflavonifractor sp.]|uniref:helix-turn-helix domain-containing protein n=1 Tax=uncultured Pseudoflavonifractor sp. TaxID=1221379 RepID=UPI0025E8617E|nr:helix-turn-helix transcriptional regulator [uncultured Pseudoflavonifractor sp.]